QDVEEDHHRPGEERGGDEAEANNRRIDAGVIGDTGGDAHDLGVPRLIRKRPFMSSFLGERGLQAIGSEVAAETSRSAEMKAPAKIVAVSRIEVNVIG